jgi:hypothetical protein
MKKLVLNNSEPNILVFEKNNEVGVREDYE